MKNRIRSTATPRRDRTGSLGLGAWLLGGAATLLAAGAGALAQDEPDLIETRSALELLVETRGVLSKEKRDWALTKEYLQHQMDLRNSEIASLQATIDETRASISEADASLEELATNEATLSGTEAFMLERIAAQEARTLALLARMPEGFLTKVELFSQRIPKDPAETKQTLAERYQNVIAVLNAANKFNQQSEVSLERRTLANGDSAEVSTLYLGFGQGWYVSADGTLAGVGRPTATAWRWSQGNAMAAEIQRAIQIQQGEATPNFVSLPVRVQ